MSEVLHVLNLRFHVCFQLHCLYSNHIASIYLVCFFLKSENLFGFENWTFLTPTNVWNCQQWPHCLQKICQLANQQYSRLLFLLGRQESYSKKNSQNTGYFSPGKKKRKPHLSLFHISLYLLLNATSIQSDNVHFLLRVWNRSSISNNPGKNKIIVTVANYISSVNIYSLSKFCSFFCPVFCTF